MSEGLAVVRTFQAGGGKILSKLPMPSGCLEMVSLPLRHVSSHSFFRTAQFMTQFVLVHFLLADANILPRIAMLVLRSGGGSCFFSLGAAVRLFIVRV